ncbi:transforming growth factor-beta receptor-associated protein 1-like [Dorcoceras hygrometricum]|uniref:Transforming growth factor-beta receptor-associated protein 1-like n=1 Tax=Dorcoceras hygrometricum TaxID=472368 RepID=A0A2Z7D3R3_9LAMI|nr:transforming growth factor-beta receptor-associated protein 1-like [Dorcoceras hygrometricum]
MFGLHFRVENHIWNNSGNFEIFEILVKSGSRFDDILCRPCLAPTFEESVLLVIVARKVARASGNTALSSSCWMCWPLCAERLTTTVHSGHLSVAEFIELCLVFFGSLVGRSLLLLSGVSCIASAFYLCCHTTGRGGNPAGGDPGGG